MMNQYGSYASSRNYDAPLTPPPPPPPPPPPLAPTGQQSHGTSHTYQCDNHDIPDLDQSPKSYSSEDDNDNDEYDSDISIQDKEQDQEELDHSNYGNASANMETPLAAHITRKTAQGHPCVHKISFKSNKQQQLSSSSYYGAISERSGDFGSTDDDNDTGNDDDDDDDNRSISSRSSISTVTTAVLENFREGLIIPFVDVHGHNICRGLSSLAFVGIILGIILPNDPNLHGRWYPWYRWISSMIGYTYFVLWSVCFYPQGKICFLDTVGLSYHDIS